MRRTPALLIVTTAVLVSLAVPAGIAGADAPVTVGIDGPATAAPGETVSLDVTTTADTAIYGVQFELTLSTAVTGRVEKGEFLSRDASSVVLVREVDNTTVRYGETRTGTSEGTTGDGTLAHVELTVPSSTDADQLSVSFATVKASDADARPVEVSSQGTTIDIDDGTETPATDDSEGGGNGDGSGAGGGSGAASSTAAPADGTTEQATAQSARTGTAEWPAVVPSTVVERFDSTARVPVVFTLAADASLPAFVERLESSGASEIRRHDDVNSVSAVVDEETLRAVSRRSEVQQVAYDSSGTVGTAEEPTTDERGRTATTAPSTTAVTASTQAGTETTSTTFALFGQPLIPLVVAVVCGVLWWRRLEG